MRFLSIVILITVVACSAGVTAQSLGPAVYLGGGIDLSVIPRQFRSGWDDGVGGGVGFGIGLNRYIEVGISFRHSVFESDADGMLEHFNIVKLPAGTDYDISGGRFRSYELTADLRVSPRLSTHEIPFRMYFVGSVGIGRKNISAATLTATLDGVTLIKVVPESNETGAALGCGLGADYSLSSRFGLWFEFTYYGLVVSDKATAYFPIRAGLRFGLGR